MESPHSHRGAEATQTGLHLCLGSQAQQYLLTAAPAAPAATGASSLGTSVAPTKKPSGMAAPTQHHPSHTAAEEQHEASHGAMAQPQHLATLRGHSPLISLRAGQVYVPVPRSLVTQNSPTRECSLSRHGRDSQHSSLPRGGCGPSRVPGGCKLVLLGEANGCGNSSKAQGVSGTRHQPGHPKEALGKTASVMEQPSSTPAPKLSFAQISL